MRRCPKCKKETIPLKWVFLGKSNLDIKHCYLCPNCNFKIKKSNTIAYIFETFEFFLIITISIAILLNQVLDNFIIDLAISLVAYILLILIINYFKPLGIATEDYCKYGVTKFGAVFNFMVMIIIVVMAIYFLLVKPLVLHQSIFN